MSEAVKVIKAAMLLSLFPELRVLVLRKLCARDLVRLSRASKQLNALCLDVGARAVQEMLATGEDDAPLPAGLSEHVLHRLARLCGVCFVTAAFADAVIDATADMKTDAHWDLAALEKAYVVLSERELREHFNMPLNEVAKKYGTPGQWADLM